MSFGMMAIVPMPIWRSALSRNVAYEAACRREIPVLRFGRTLRVPRVSLERLLIGEGACRQ